MATGQTVELTDLAIRDMSYLAKHSDLIRPLLDFTGTQALPDNLPALYETAATQIAHPEFGVRHILRSLLNLQRVRKRLRLSTAEAVLDAMTVAIERKGVQTWDKDLWLKARTSLASALDELSDDHPLVLLEKMAELTYAHQHVLNETRVITDIRPVFGSDTEAVVRAIITHNLLIEYFDGVDHKRMEFVLDAADVANLKRLCERAELKATTLKESLSTLNWGPTIPRQENSG